MATQPITEPDNEHWLQWLALVKEEVAITIASPDALHSAEATQAWTPDHTQAQTQGAGGAPDGLEGGGATAPHVHES